jgi:hypothetical protein
MILWIITIGGLASVGTGDQAWFTNTLSEECFAAGIREPGELSLFLAEFLWSDFYLGAVFKEFWENVFIVQAIQADEL